ncbi:hypothetical protein BT63DRAFT_442332 [Microthyrium microscopicum]|uniref:Myb-like domain-containing protein n=1 Tax=Microthyrium microscopicum TaxID=703497 RepID=A0A6A6U1M3_9PEZI|nr:hypothetical protein BT63DRAFT_442332 [Microthyrium microscopicum]
MSSSDTLPAATCASQSPSAPMSGVDSPSSSSHHWLDGQSMGQLASNPSLLSQTTSTCSPYHGEPYSSGIDGWSLSDSINEPDESYPFDTELRSMFAYEEISFDMPDNMEATGAAPLPAFQESIGFGLERMPNYDFDSFTQSPPPAYSSSIPLPSASYHWETSSSRGEIQPPGSLTSPGFLASSPSSQHHVSRTFNNEIHNQQPGATDQHYSSTMFAYCPPFTPASNNFVPVPSDPSRHGYQGHNSQDSFQSDLSSASSVRADFHSPNLPYYDDHHHREPSYPTPPPPLPCYEPPTSIPTPASTKNPKPDTPERDSIDEFILAWRSQGKTYKEIKDLGNLDIAESTLRGRYRTLIKPKNQRVRKPEWQPVDIQLLNDAVAQQCRTNNCTTQGVQTLAQVNGLSIQWKEVASYILQHGGSYAFGNATCKKKWLAEHGIS